VNFGGKWWGGNFGGILRGFDLAARKKNPVGFLAS